MTIGITGATGQLGRLAVEALKSRVPASEILALVRDPTKAADLGVAARAFDYIAPDIAALDGVDVLVLISSSSFDDRAGQHRRVIESARAAGVKRIVYTGILKGAASPMLLSKDHIETEAALRASGVPHTVLRNGWYIENKTGSLGGAIATGALIGSSGEGRFSAAARQDFAEAIAVVATEDGHVGKAYELAGDTAFTMKELAAEVSRQTGKTIGYNDLPLDVYAGILVGFGLPEGFAHVLAESDVQAAHGALYDDSHTLSRLIGRPTTPLAEMVRQALA